MRMLENVMPRSVRVTVPPAQTDALVNEIKSLHGPIGLIGLRVQRGISIQPEGDVVSVEVSNRGLPALLRVLSKQGIGSEPGSSIGTLQPQSVVAPSHKDLIVADASEATWEEIESTLARESNMAANALFLMAAAGSIAAVGICRDALHLVVGAVLISPGFEPLSRIALGVVAGSGAWRRGLADTGKGYLALGAGAAATALVLRALGYPPLGGRPSYLPAGSLLHFWTSVTTPGLIVSAVAGAAGTVLISANRAILTAGAMIALGLVPSAAITGMALITGNFGSAGKGMIRWSVEAAFVCAFSALVYWWKQVRVHRRRLEL
jgi:hypothetical protein